MELLVVISIISILASMLLPALKEARNRANAAVCQSNQKQLATALATYSVDYNGYIPPPLNVKLSDWWDDWQYQLSPYLGFDSEEIKKASKRRNTVFWCKSNINPMRVIRTGASAQCRSR